MIRIVAGRDKTNLTKIRVDTPILGVINGGTRAVKGGVVLPKRLLVIRQEGAFIPNVSCPKHPIGPKLPLHCQIPRGQERDMEVFLEDSVQRRWCNESGVRPRHSRAILLREWIRYPRSAERIIERSRNKCKLRRKRRSVYEKIKNAGLRGDVIIAGT